MRNVLKMIIDDYAHQDYGEPEGLEDEQTGEYCFLVSFTFDSEWAMYGFDLQISRFDLFLIGENPNRVPVERREAALRLLDGWNARRDNLRKQGEYQLNEKGFITYVFYQDRPLGEEWDDFEIRGSLEEVRIALDDVFPELMAFLYGDKCIFTIR